jgi:hypothetical protein
MGKRASSPPRRPRDPVAKAVRTPRFKQQVVPDKRWPERLKEETIPARPGRDPETKD